MATAETIVDALLRGFHYLDHPPVQAALNHLFVLIELKYKVDEDADSSDRLRYEAVLEAIKAFKMNPLGNAERLKQEIYDAGDDPELVVAAEVLEEAVDRVARPQPRESEPTLEPEPPPRPRARRSESPKADSPEPEADGEVSRSESVQQRIINRLLDKGKSAEGEAVDEAAQEEAAEEAAAPGAGDSPVPRQQETVSPPAEPGPEPEEGATSPPAAPPIPAPSAASPPAPPAAAPPPADDFELETLETMDDVDTERVAHSYPAPASEPQAPDEADAEKSVTFSMPATDDDDSGEASQPEEEMPVWLSSEEADDLSLETLEVDEEEFIDTERVVAVKDDEPELLEREEQHFMGELGSADADGEAETGTAQPKKQARETTGEAETVEAHFSAYYPPQIKPAMTYGLYVYAHTPETYKAIHEDVSQFRERMGGDVPEPATADQQVMLKVGTAITVVPECESVRFDPPHVTQVWQGDWSRFDFDMTTRSGAQNTLKMRVSIQVAGIEIAHIPCEVKVASTAAEPALSINPLADARLRSATAQMYQKIFISYSRDDASVAEAYRLAQQAAGHDVFMDSYSIRTGENWQAALARAIDEADIFQLFWSKHAAESGNVRDEWDYALGYRCPDDRCVQFIRPVFWEHPMLPPPSELAHLNFKYVPFTASAASSSEPSSARLNEMQRRLEAIEATLAAIQKALGVDPEGDNQA